MKRVYRFAMLAVCLAAWGALAPSAPAQSPAAADALKFVPDDALGVVIVQHLSKLDDDSTKIVTEMNLPMPIPNSAIWTAMKKELNINAGVDDNGAAVVALLPGHAEAGSTGEVKDPMPEAVVFLPVTDYAKFLDQFQPDDAKADVTTAIMDGEKVVIAHKGSFAAIAKGEDKEWLTKVLSASANVTSELAPLDSWIAKRDVAAVATPAGMSKGTRAARKALKQLTAIMGEHGNKAAANMAMNDAMLRWFGEAVHEAAVGARVDDDGNLFVDSRLTFVPDTDLAKAMKEIPAASQSALTKLPGGEFVFAGSLDVPSALSGVIGKLTTKVIEQMGKANPDAPAPDAEQQKKSAEAVAALMQGIQSASFVLAAPKPGETMLAGMVEVVKVDNAPQYLDRYEKLYPQIVESMKNSPAKFDSVKRIDIDGHSALQLTMDVSKLSEQPAGGAAPAPGIPGLPGGQQKIMQWIFGADGKMNICLVAVDDHTLVEGIREPDHIKELLKSLKNPDPNFTADPDIATTTKLLPSDAPWVGFISIKGYSSMLMSMMAQMMPPGFPMPQMPQFPKTGAIGLAAKPSGDGLEGTLVMPKETFEEIGQYATLMIQMRGAPGGGGPQPRRPAFPPPPSRKQPARQNAPR